MDNREDRDHVGVVSLVEIVRGRLQRDSGGRAFSEETVLRDHIMRDVEQRAMLKRLASIGDHARVNALTSKDLFFAQQIEDILLGYQDYDHCNQDEIQKAVLGYCLEASAFWNVSRMLHHVPDEYQEALCIFVMHSQPQLHNLFSLDVVDLYTFCEYYLSSDRRGGYRKQALDVIVDHIEKGTGPAYAAAIRNHYTSIILEANKACRQPMGTVLPFK